MNAWMKVQFQNLMAFLVAHPVVKNFLDWAVKSVLVAVASYVMTALNPSQGSTFNFAGLAAVVGLTVKAVIQHAFDVFLLNSAPATPQATLALKRGGSVPPQISGGSMKKIGLFFALFLLMASTAMAWDLPGAPFSYGPQFQKLALIAPVSTENDWILMPITDVNFNLGQADNYGLGAAYGLVFAAVQPEDATHVNVNPFFFIGPFISANVGEFVNSNGKDAPSAEFGFVVGLPKLDANIPEIGVQCGWDTRGGPAILSIDASFPLMIAPDSTIVKL